MHLNTETALDLIDGHLGTAEEAGWRTHLSTCPDCFAFHEGSLVLRDTLKRSHLQSAPKPFLTAAQNLFPFEAAPEKPSRIRQVVASLVFDSFLQPAFAGARGSNATRQLVLRAEEFDIHIRVSTTQDSRELMGQIQPRGRKTLSDAPRLHLLRNGERVSSAEVNDLGEFSFSFVPEGLLSLQIDLPHLTVIGALDVNE